MASKFILKLTQSQPPSVSPSPHNHSLQVYLQIHSITAYKCISKLTRLWPATSHSHGLQCISKLALSRSRSASVSSLDHGLQVYLQICSITASRSISKLAQLWPASSHDYGIQVHLQSHLIMPSECISQFTRSSFSGAPGIALKQCLQPVQIYCV